MLKKVYYYKFRDIFPNSPLEIKSFEDIWEDITTAPIDYDYAILPYGYESDTADILISQVLLRYSELAIIKIERNINDSEPTEAEIKDELVKWFWKYVSLFNDTYEYYNTILYQYNVSRTELMADIKATTENKVKFNDTPQNPNNLNVYEGDNYITNFTKSESETKSPLMTKMMRLKELQENYRDILTEWVKDFRKIFYEVEC